MSIFNKIEKNHLWWAIAGILLAALFYCAFGMLANIVPSLTLAFVLLFFTNWNGTARLDYFAAVSLGGLAFQLISLL